MQLSKFSDYSFRTLIYLAENAPGLSTVEKMAKALQISQNHLKKIIHRLAKGQFVESFKGREGGVRLARPPQQINLSAVLLYTESNIDLVDCLKQKPEEACPYQAECNLKLIISEAREAFIAEFKKHYLSDLLASPAIPAPRPKD